MKKIKVGIAGLGRLGKVHANNIAFTIPNAELTAACSIGPAELEYAKEKLGVTDVYTDYREMARELNRPAAEPRREAAPARERAQGKRKLRFSFREQREFETIDADIAALEERSARLEAAMDAAAADYVELERLGAEKSAVDEELAAKVDRWVYLNELNERIQRGEYED